METLNSHMMQSLIVLIIYIAFIMWFAARQIKHELAEYWFRLHQNVHDSREQLVEEIEKLKDSKEVVNAKVIHKFLKCLWKDQNVYKPTNGEFIIARSHSLIWVGHYNAENNCIESILADSELSSISLADTDGWCYPHEIFPPIED